MRDHRALYAALTLGVALAVAIALAIVGCSPAAAEPLSCNKWEKVASYLAKDHREHPVAFGILRGERFLIELYVSDKGSWSIVETNAQTRIACIRADGTDWTRVPPKGDPS